VLFLSCTSSTCCCDLTSRTLFPSITTSPKGKAEDLLLKKSAPGKKSNAQGAAQPVAAKARDKAKQELTVAPPKATLPSTEVVAELREEHPRITDRQHELICTMLQEPGTVMDAAGRIGADPSWCYTTLRKPWVVAYSTELARQTLHGHALTALAVQGQLLHAKSDWLKHEVAKDILDRSGFRVQTEGPRAPSVEVNINLD